ncbi:MAG TPA: methylmalonyl Co-A mutase-associated GTPase MeaB, partial [Gaiellales bacterium]
MPRPAIDLDALAEGVRAGDRALLARAITLVESRQPVDQAPAQELLVRLLPATGSAERLGVTGVPGAGKSVLIERLGEHVIDQGLRVAVLVIDPSSRRTGGSILGDKTRMQRLAVRNEAFIRPSPSSGVLGGVARRTREALLVCEAAGYDVVIVESVGVGQSEAQLADLVDCLCLVLAPGTGDELQGIKRGIVELADVVAVNKADGSRLGDARRAASDYRQALRLLAPSLAGWQTPVVTCSALEGTGIAELWEAIRSHRGLLAADGALAVRRREQELRWLEAAVD